jgi:hypothetical protein
MRRLRRLATGFLVFAAAARAVAAPTRVSTPPPSPALGVAVNLGSAASAAERQVVLDAVRRTGASFFALELSWSRAEPRPGEYRLEEITRTARLLRQSGATLHLDLPLVTETARDVPADLKDVAFDDPKLSLRLGKLIDALAIGLLDFQSLSLGQGADSYFASRPDELRAFLRLFDGAVPFLRKKAPHLLVGVTTAAPDESPAPEVAAALHRRSPALFYAYAPFVRGEPFVQRGPNSLEADWTALLKSAAGRPIGFPVVSFSSSVDNGASPEKQAEFVHRLLRFVAKADGRRLLFARYVALRDSPEDSAPPGGPVAERRRRAFLSHRGLQTVDGLPKPAWKTWVREAPAVKK